MRDNAPMHSAIMRVQGSVSRNITHTRGSDSLFVRSLSTSCERTALRPKIKEITCPVTIKRTIENVFFPGVKIKPSAVSNMLDIYTKAIQIDSDVRRFAQEIREAAKDYYTPFCIRKGPVNSECPKYLPNKMFGEIVMKTLALEISDEHFLQGRDSAVEGFHVDIGLQGLSELKHALMLSCVQNPGEIPFEVIPWTTIRSEFSEAEIHDLKKHTSVVNTEMVTFSVETLYIDDKGREQLFLDQSLRMNSDPLSKKLIDTIDKHSNKALIFNLDPGDCVFMYNFSGVHRRGSGGVSGFSSKDYIDRKMIRFDIIDSNGESRRIR